MIKKKSENVHFQLYFSTLNMVYISPYDQKCPVWPLFSKYDVTLVQPLHLTILYVLTCKSLSDACQNLKVWSDMKGQIHINILLIEALFQSHSFHLKIQYWHVSPNTYRKTADCIYFVLVG